MVTTRKAAGPGRDRLSTYRAKRRFTTTPEPAGAPPRRRRGPGGRFVVQRHRARRLHYDFRLELDGVLVSWAVPKGPTLDPKTRRQAVHVEDHPLEYFSFEGVIPKGQYGGGDVIVWDWGTWRPAEGVDASQAVESGELHFDLDGQRLHGRFVLVRTADGGSGKEKWLLLHKRDDFAVEDWDPEQFPTSVKSARTNDEVAQAPSARWRSDRPAKKAEERLRPDAARRATTGEPACPAATSRMIATLTGITLRIARDNVRAHLPDAVELAATGTVDPGRVVSDVYLSSSGSVPGRQWFPALSQRPLNGSFSTSFAMRTRRLPLRFAIHSGRPPSCPGSG